MANEIEIEIVKRAYENTMLHPNHFLEWVGVVFMLMLIAVLLMALSSLYYVAIDIYKNIKQRNANVVTTA